MLAGCRPALLERLEFPLGELDQARGARAAPRAAGLAVAEKPESQDLCFLAGHRHATASSTATAGSATAPGDDRSIATGRARPPPRPHRFTVGQRRGLGVAAPQPLYVLDVDAAANAVTVGTRDELDTTTVRLVGARLLRDGAEVDRVKLRYRNAPVACRVDGARRRPGATASCDVELESPVAGAAPGQIACLMRRRTVVGWARSPARRA